MNFTRRNVGCGGCLNVKNYWGLLTWDDGVGLGERKIYHQLADFSIMEELNRKVVIKYIFTPDFLCKIDLKDGLGCLYTLVNCKL